MRQGGSLLRREQQTWHSMRVTRELKLQWRRIDLQEVRVNTGIGLELVVQTHGFKNTQVYLE